MCPGAGVRVTAGREETKLIHFIILSFISVLMFILTMPRESDHLKRFVPLVAGCGMY